ncbi:hypothetical protein RVS70_05315 [Virgibacillus sp. M23]|uniref:hypothetical protein n=1 Tax=Virgibacillus sp. M23 TaxID=3079030 RepID=UPI002A912512|nr:hypothetical protein [Virgibacillus sp. M23]MDY7043620.1 hypothetical protein [Virgibacillus sp. M23]
MVYDLKPKNEELDWFSMGAFSWSWMLDAGVGLVLGQGKGIKPATYRYIPDENGASPRSNDGYYVDEEKAKIMAQVARGLVSVERGKTDEWNAMSEEEREQIDKWSLRSNIYNLPIREDFVDKAEKFADWSEKSGGFEIH